MSLELQKLTIFWLRIAEQKIQKCLEPKLAKHGISLSAFRLIGQLLGSDDGLIQKELASRIGVEPASISVALRHLEKAGLVERFDDPDDKRLKRVRCKEQAPEILAVFAVLKELESQAVKGFSKDEAQFLQKLLSRVIQNFS